MAVGVTEEDRRKDDVSGGKLVRNSHVRFIFFSLLMLDSGRVRPPPSPDCPVCIKHQCLYESKKNKLINM